MMERMVMGESKDLYNGMLAAQGLALIDGSLFDVSYRSPNVVFVSGVPGFAYPQRSALAMEFLCWQLAFEKARMMSMHTWITSGSGLICIPRA